MKNSGKCYDYITLLSDQDYPLTNNETIVQFLSENKGKQFVHWFKMPCTNLAGDGGMDQVQYFYPSFFMDRNRIKQKLLNLYKKTMKKLKLKRNLNIFSELYGGSSWFTITYDCLEYILDFVDREKWYLKFF